MVSKFTSELFSNVFNVGALIVDSFIKKQKHTSCNGHSCLLFRFLSSHTTPRSLLRLWKLLRTIFMPTQTQLYNKIAATKKTVFPSSKVRNTHELRMKVAEYLEEPESELQAFVPYHEIVDDDESSDPRFTIIFTTQKNLGKLKSERVLQTDATYRLNWNGFPVFVVGKGSIQSYFCLSIYLFQEPPLPLEGSLPVV